MKKNRIIAAVASLALVITMFAACGKGDDGESTNPTVVGDDGQVYVEVTEVVTDASGEAVTDAEGNTQVVSVTKPVETTAGDTATTGSGQSEVEGTTTYEDVVFPEGEEIEVEVDDKGRPEDSKMQSLVDAITKKKSFYISLTFVNDNSLGEIFGSGISMKFYLKDTKFAMDMPLGLATIRIMFDGENAHIVLPTTKNYITYPAEEESTALVDECKAMWDSLDSSAMDYDSTTVVKIRGVEYTCEIYNDGTNINKYYFDSNGDFKRMETIASDGTTSIVKVNECSSDFDESIFSVPKSYQPISEDALVAMFGSMNLTD